MVGDRGGLFCLGTGVSSLLGIRQPTGVKVMFCVELG